MAWNLASLTCLALAMPLHHRRVFQRVPGVRAQRVWRWSGWTGLLVGVGCVLRTEAWQVGVVTNVALLAVDGLVLTLLLTYAPKKAPMMAGAGLVAAVAMML